MRRRREEGYKKNPDLVQCLKFTIEMSELDLCRSCFACATQFRAWNTWIARGAAVRVCRNLWHRIIP